MADSADDRRLLSPPCSPYLTVVQQVLANNFAQHLLAVCPRLKVFDQGEFDERVKRSQQRTRHGQQMRPATGISMATKTGNIYIPGTMTDSVEILMTIAGFYTTGVR